MDFIQPYKPRLYKTNFAEFTGVYKFDRIAEMLLAALPLPYLYGAAMLLLVQLHRAAFNDGVAHGFFYVHIFTGGAGICHLQAMPWSGVP